MTTRRDVIAVSLGAVLSLAGAAKAQTPPKTFVLVHGAWGGGWVWRRVVDLLERRGHKVFAPTMTGVGERSHLLDAHVNLTTHVRDIVNVIKWERLEEVVLVGHSYGGMVITGVAEQVHGKIGSIVFLDAFVPENGQSSVDLSSNRAQQLIQTALDKREISLTSPSSASFNVNENDRAWVDAMSTPHPIASFTEKLATTGARERIPKKAYVRATSAGAGFNAVYAKYRATAGWRTYEVPCGHFVMIDMPDRLTEILLELS